MGSEFASVVFGLSSALVWGAGDFLGGLSSRRSSVLGALLVNEVTGLLILILCALLFQEPFPSNVQIGWSMAAGIVGTLGLGALYLGLATARATIVAPVSAVIGALLPAVYGALTIGLPDSTKQVGFGIAIAAIILISYSNQGVGEMRALGLAILAGIGFGLFFIFIHQGSNGGTFFPLVFSRGIATPIVFALLLWQRAPLPSRQVLPLAMLSGIFDAGGNIFFLLSSTFGRLDVATILSSLYPASTVILSRIFLHEKISRLQQLGVALALAAIVLIAL
jgi:drug/metabolite transporter (DMT)-like permease